MSRLQNSKHTLNANVGLIIRRSNGQRFDQWASNIQISTEGIVAGTWQLEYRPHGSTQFIIHAQALTLTDIVVLSGQNAPIVDELKITSTTAGSCVLTTWPRF